MSRTDPPHVVLFFTRNTSLDAWDEVGIFAREVALYQHLQDLGFRVTFVTYGGKSDLRHAPRIPGIDIVCNRWALSGDRYRFLLTHWYPRFWGPRAIFKSNQVKGADVVLDAARRFGRPFVARCGYLHSDFCEREHGYGSKAARDARELEGRVFGGATRVTVTTDAMAKQVMKAYGVDDRRLSVVPNFVDTALFAPCPKRSANDRPKLVFVGRLIGQKNLSALFQAIEGLDVDLLIVGHDVLRDELEKLAAVRKLSVTFAGNVPHPQLPELLATADLFVLPSLYEGHPKVLLEAMACGLPILGTDVPGISEVVRHGETGWLCGTSAAELRVAISMLIADRALLTRLGAAARSDVAERFSLPRIVDTEVDVLYRAMEPDGRSVQAPREAATPGAGAW